MKTFNQIERQILASMLIASNRSAFREINLAEFFREYLSPFPNPIISSLFNGKQQFKVRWRLEENATSVSGFIINVEGTDGQLVGERVELFLVHFVGMLEYLLENKYIIFFSRDIGENFIPLGSVIIGDSTTYFVNDRSWVERLAQISRNNILLNQTIIDYVDDVFETKEEKLTRQALEKAETANQTAIKSLGVAKKANCLAWIGIAAAIVIPSFFSNEQIKQADIQIEQAKQQILQSESQLKREKEEELQDSAFRHSIKMNLDSIILLEKKIFKVIKRPK